MRPASALVAALIVLSGCSSVEEHGGFGEPAAPVESTGPSPAPLPVAHPIQELRISAPGGLRFDPQTLEIRSGKLTEITFTNEDSQEHTLVISELAVVMLAAPGQTVKSTVAIDPKNQGEFTYFCSVSGHREGGMQGMITVR